MNQGNGRETSQRTRKYPLTGAMQKSVRSDKEICVTVPGPSLRFNDPRGWKSL